MVLIKTPIVYYGGKTAIVQHLLEMVPVHDVYTETFFGGGTLFWAKEPVRAETINDKRGDVINFYRILKTKYKPLKKLIDQSLQARDIHHEANTLLRKSWRGEKVDKLKLAWAFWYAANFSYSRKLGSGMAYSNEKCASECDKMSKRKIDFTEQLVQRIEHTYIENDDAIKILRSRNNTWLDCATANFSDNAFHYLDPPYPNADQGHYRGYGWNDYQNLLNFLALENKGKFLLSSYNSEILDSYIQQHDWIKKEITHRLKAPRKSGMEKTEVLVSNLSTPCGTLKLF